MRKELYDSLSEVERAMYDELCASTKRIVERLEVLSEIIKKAIEVADA